MARADGPLFSLEASGSTKKTITYKRHNGSAIICKHSKPGSVNALYPSAGQNVSRFLYSLAQTGWATMDDIDKANYNDLASEQSTPMTGFNYFVKKVFETDGFITGLTDWWPMSVMDDFMVPNLIRKQGALRAVSDILQPEPTVVKADYKRLPYMIYSNSEGSKLRQAGPVDYSIGKDDMGLMMYIRPYIFSLNDIVLYSHWDQGDAKGVVLAITPTGTLKFVLSDGVSIVARTTVQPLSLGQISCIVFDIERGGKATMYVNGEKWDELDCSILDGVDIQSNALLILLKDFAPNTNPQIQGAHCVLQTKAFGQLRAQYFTRFIKPNTPINKT